MSNNPFTEYSKVYKSFITELDLLELKKSKTIDDYIFEVYYDEMMLEKGEPEPVITGEVLFKNIDKRDVLSKLLESFSISALKFMQGHYNLLLKQNKLQDWQTQLEYYRYAADKVSAELIDRLPLYESTIKSHFEYIKDSIPVVYNTVINIPVNVIMLGNAAVKHYLETLIAQLYHIFTLSPMPLIDKNTNPNDFEKAFSDKDNTSVKLMWIAKKKSGNGANLMVWFFRDILCGKRKLMNYEAIEPWLFNTFVDIKGKAFKKSNARKWAKTGRIETDADKNDNILKKVNLILGNI